MPARIRLYDVEPRLGRSVKLPDWTKSFGLDVLPAIGDELKVVDNPEDPESAPIHFWRVIRSTCEPSPLRTDPAYTLGVRFIS